MENKEIFNTKVQILERINIAEFKYHLYLNFQGIYLSFHTNQIAFKKLVQDSTPSSWQQDQGTTDNIDIYHTDISEIDFTIDKWSNESSQNCYFERESIIHRDFAAKKVNDYKYNLICPNQDSDGLFNFLRMLMPKLLFTKSRYIIHSSCVLTHNQEAILFLGHSGHGKSTIASLCGERLILSDDMNIIDMNTMKINAACLGHAYHTNGSYDISYPIKKMYWILKDSKNFEVSINKAQASLLLLSSITNLFWDQLSKGNIEKVMSDVEIMATKIPMNHLYFKKDESIWKMID